MTIENKYTPYAQRGFATVLIVLLVGLAVAASALGTAYYINSSQKSLVSSHALTNAQSGAWTGVEIFRKYLDRLDEAGIASLNKQNLTLKVQGCPKAKDCAELKVSNISSEPSNNPKQYRVTANIQNISEKSEASSTVQVVYEISGTSNSSTEDNSSENNNFENIMNFYGGLTVGGDIILKNGNDKAIINVDGNVKTKSVSLTGIKTINSTGDVEIESGVSVDNIYANGNITLLESAVVKSIASAQKEINMNSWGTPQGSFYANGNIKLNGAGIKSADTLGDIISKVWSRLGNGIAKGTVECVGSGWTQFDLLQASKFKNCPTIVGKTYTPPLNSPQGAFAPVSLANRPLVNALNTKYINEANYIFNFNTIKNRPIVTIQNVKDIHTGDYEIGRYFKNKKWYWGHLCKELNSDNTCKTQIVGNIYPDLSENQRISYGSGVWIVDDEVGNSTGTVGSKNPPRIPSLAPGVMLFHGDVVMPRGLFVNTILSTGKITYGTNVSLYSPNYAGASSTCNVSIYKMPDNLCLSNLTMTNATIGNIALLAGSCTDESSLNSCQATYKGGTIKLESSAYIYGNIIAGNILDTSGSSHIVGVVLAAALGNVSTGNKLDATTTIDFDGVSDKTNFQPSIPGTPSNPENGVQDTKRVSIKWARYLYELNREMDPEI